MLSLLKKQKNVKAFVRKKSHKYDEKARNGQ